MGSPSQRIGKLIKFIYENPGKKPGEIAKALGIGRRTLGNYLAQLKKEGIIEVREKSRVYPPPQFSSSFFLSEEEKLWIAVLLGFASLNITIPIERKKLEEIQEKVVGGQQIPDILRKKRIYIAENPISPPRAGEHIMFSRSFYTVLSAIQEGVGLEILYKEPGRFPRKFEIIPLYLAFRRRAWYILSHLVWEEGKDGGSELIFPPRRKFRLTRVISIKKREDIKRERDEEPEAFFRNAWEFWEGGDVEEVIIELDEKAYDLIREVRWHPSEEILWEGGKFLYRVRVANPEEMIPWIAQFGPHAKILHPPWLRRKFRESLEKTMENYMEDTE